MYVIARIRLAITNKVNTKSGTRMQSGFGFIDMADGEDLPCGLAAFNNLADTLAKYKKGDVIRVTGDFHRNDYTNKKGDEVEGWQITLDGLMGVKNASAQHNQPKVKGNATGMQQAAQAAFYEDSLDVIDNR